MSCRRPATSRRCAGSITAHAAKSSAPVAPQQFGELPVELVPAARRAIDAVDGVDRCAGPAMRPHRAAVEGSRFPLCQPAALEAAFANAGLIERAVEGLVVETRFADFDDFWLPFLGGAGPAPAYVSSLRERGRRALGELLSQTLPRDADGAIRLSARAWAVRGEVAG